MNKERDWRTREDSFKEMWEKVRSKLELNPGLQAKTLLLFFTLNREDFSFVIHLNRQPRTSRRREAQTGSRARSGSRSERTLDAVEHSRTLMEWWPFLIFHRGGLRIKVINNTRASIGFSIATSLPHVHADRFELRGSLWSELAEKPQQRLGLALLSRPDDPAAEMVYYHC